MAAPVLVVPYETKPFNVPAQVMTYPLPETIGDDTGTTVPNSVLASLVENTGSTSPTGCIGSRRGFTSVRWMADDGPLTTAEEPAGTIAQPTLLHTSMAPSPVETDMAFAPV